MLHPRSASRGLARSTAFALLVAAAGCAVQTGDEPTGQVSQASVCAAGTVVKGVDVSVYQGTVNWTSVKAAGMDFAIARISDGSALDTEFATNWSGMKSAGLVRGAYQYFEPGKIRRRRPTSSSAPWACSGRVTCPSRPTWRPPAASPPRPSPPTSRRGWPPCRPAPARRRWFYTAEGYWDSDVASSAFASNPLWVANWGVTCPTLPTGWSNWEFWQDADNGTVAGISGAVDTDEFNGSLSQLQAFAGGGTASDGGVAGIYGATYVSQSWPLASTTMMMTTCQTVAASITFKNSGTLPWNGNTRLGTTQPRDRASVFADSTWISTDRAAQVSGTVAPGGTFEFKFDFHAPPTAGSYKEYFGLVQDGVAWFSDPGQGGPADDDIEANIQVTAGSTNCTADPGVPDGGSSAEGGTTIDSGVAAEAGSTASDSGTTGSTGPTGDAATEPGSDAGSTPPAAGSSSGCGCDTAGSRGIPAAAALGMAFVLGAAARRRRR